MTSELHWTGAALLLAVAMPGGRSTRPRHGEVLGLADDVPQHGFDVGERWTPDESSEGPAMVPVATGNVVASRERTVAAGPAGSRNATRRRGLTHSAANPAAGQPEQRPQPMLYRAE